MSWLLEAFEMLRCEIVWGTVYLHGASHYPYPWSLDTTFCLQLVSASGNSSSSNIIHWSSTVQAQPICQKIRTFKFCPQPYVHDIKAGRVQLGVIQSPICKSCVTSHKSCSSPSSSSLLLWQHACQSLRQSLDAVAEASPANTTQIAAVACAVICLHLAVPNIAIN
jgi:hypothetical protein